MQLHKKLTDREDGVDYDYYVLSGDANSAPAIIVNSHQDFDSIMEDRGFQEARGVLGDPPIEVHMIAKVGPHLGKYSLQMKVRHALNRAPEKIPIGR